MGADANADTPRYTNQNGTQTSTDLYANSSAAREWLYDSVKEQRQVDPGVLENTTIGIVIDTDDTSIPVQDLINLVADSAGISREEARQKITIIRACHHPVRQLHSPLRQRQPRPRPEVFRFLL